MKTQIFKKGDTVYCVLFGKGEVIYYNAELEYPIWVDYPSGKQQYSVDGRYSHLFSPTLSHTPYTLEGFSQREPLPIIEVDTLVYVRDSDSHNWGMRYFSHFDEDGYMVCFSDQNKSTSPNNPKRWNMYSLTNPLV